MFKKLLNRLKGRAPAKEVFSDIHKKTYGEIRSPYQARGLTL
jgi:hypothetical protein